jgi:hypothetical protein
MIRRGNDALNTKEEKSAEQDKRADEQTHGGNQGGHTRT